MSDRQNMPAELKQVTDELLKTWNDYREHNDKALSEIKKGQEDIIRKDEMAKLDQKMNELQDDLQGLHKKLNRARMVSKEANSEREAKGAVEFGRWLSAAGQKDVGYDDAARARLAYKSAMVRYMRQGDKALSADEAKALQVGSTPDGGYFVEPARADWIIERIRDTSDVRSVANVMAITTKSLEIPVDRGEFDAGWVGENDDRDETNTSQVGEMEIPVHEMFAQPRATQNMLDDAGIDIETWVDQKVADKLARIEATAFVTGDGIKKPKGFLAAPVAATADTARAFGTLEIVKTGANGAFSATPGDDLINLVTALRSYYRTGARFAMSRTTVGAVRKMKDGQGNYLWQPSFQLGQAGQVLGFAISEWEDMPAIAPNSLSIAFGNFAMGYTIVDRQGIRQLRDPYTKKGHVKFYTTRRVGGDVTDSDAIKLLQFAA